MAAINLAEPEDIPDGLVAQTNSSSFFFCQIFWRQTAGVERPWIGRAASHFLELQIFFAAGTKFS